MRRVLILLALVSISGCSIRGVADFSDDRFAPLMYMGEGTLEPGCGGTCYVEVQFDEVDVHRWRRRVFVTGTVRDRETGDLLPEGFVELIVGTRSRGAQAEGQGPDLEVRITYPIPEDGRFVFTAVLGSGENLHFGAKSCWLETYSLAELDAMESEHLR